jgi:hypothetical protein
MLQKICQEERVIDILLKYTELNLMGIVLEEM